MWTIILVSLIYVIVAIILEERMSTNLPVWATKLVCIFWIFAIVVLASMYIFGKVCGYFKIGTFRSHAKVRSRED